MPNKEDSPRVAIVCDWLIGGGAERVVYELHLLYPEAPIYTSYCNSFWRRQLQPSKVITSYMQNWPFYSVRKFIPFLRVWWFSSLNLKNYDIVISASGAEAKGITVKGSTKHISYIHAPTHYYWGRYDQYLHQPGFGRFDQLARFGLKKLIGPMRAIDFKSAQKPDVLIANSVFTQEQILKYYHRNSMVIHPPVRTKKFSKYAIKTADKQGFIISGRHTPYKKFELAVIACAKAKVSLSVIGNGPQTSKLKSIAGSNTNFIDKVSDNELAKLIGSSEAFIFPGIEDFGIAPVEALAAGTPVLAYKKGGALDYIKPGVNGEFFSPQSPTALAKLIAKFDGNKYTQNDIKRSADSFSTETFRKKITKLVNSL